MVRMTDLLKKAKMQSKVEVPAYENKKPKAKASPRQEQAPEKEEVKFAEVFFTGANEPLPTGEDIAGKFIKASVQGEEDAKKLYLDSIMTIQRVFDAYRDSASMDEKEIMDIANKFVNNILSGSRALLKLFHESDSLELYIYYNAVNVSILSVELGVAANYNKSILIDLAVIGLLHDLDLIKSKDIVDTQKKLDEKEREQMQQHPLNAASFIDNAFHFTKEIINGILQHHERKEGQGYPAALADTQIQDLAELVGLVDTYESMTHSRPYKEKINPHAAVLKIINTCKDLFSSELIKALVSRVGLYPMGSWVQLNTGEVCKVIEVNPDFPLRPAVSILMDKDKRKFREIRTIDLQKIPSLYIKNIVDSNIVNS